MFGSPKPVFFQQTTDAREVWPAVNYAMAALMIRNGKQYGIDSLVQKGLELSKAVAYQTWDKTSNGYAFKTPESWVVLNKDPNSDGQVPVPVSDTVVRTDIHRNLNYGRPMTVWDTIDALAPGVTKNIPDPLPVENDKAPVLTHTPVPTISGTATFGNTLMAKTGTWDSGVTFAYTWKVGAAVVAGATESTFKIRAADVGKRITVAVTGSKPGYASVTKTSAPSAAVKAATFKSRPVPHIAGTVKVGRLLRAKPGNWGAGVKFTYAWYAGGKQVAAAKYATWKIPASKRGKRITVKVTAHKAGYSTVTKTSKATRKVR